MDGQNVSEQLIRFERRVMERLSEIDTKLGEIMAAQDDINAAVTAITAVTTDLATAAANIQGEIANLNSQIAAGGGTPVDTTALDTAVTALQQAQAAVDALETPATPPAA